MSYRIPNPTQIQKKYTGNYVAHGYSASTFEWEEFNDWSENRKTLYVSRILLDGHGRDYESFKKSIWKDW